MGLERLSMIVQNKKSTYEIDIFQSLISKIIQLASQSNINSNHSQKDKDIAYRVISDHARAVCISILDGQMPSNNKAGYVIRRILRRAIRYGYTFLRI